MAVIPMEVFYMLFGMNVYVPWNISDSDFQRGFSKYIPFFSLVTTGVVILLGMLQVLWRFI